MNSWWSSYFPTTLTLLFTVGNHLVKAQLECSDGRFAQGSCGKLHSRANICSDLLVQADVCPTVQPISADYVREIPRNSEGCPQYPRRDRRVATPNLSLSLSPVVHNTIHYNLTVSWEHLQLTVLAGSSYHLKLFSDPHEYYRCICSTTPQATDGPPSWTRDSFDGLVFPNGLDYRFVELTIFYPNGSVFVVIATDFDRPRGCLEVLPVSLYRCPRIDDALRYQTVRNLTHSLTQPTEGSNGTVVELSWEPSANAAQYMLLAHYYITVLLSGYPSETFETNLTSIRISPLQPSIEYAVQVQQFIPCSTGCGENVTREILTKPSSPPEIIQAFPLSASNINVTWNEIPKSNYKGFIIIYEVQYTSESEDLMVVNSTSHSINLSGLKAFTVYSISVRGYTSAGPGPFSEEITCTTRNETTPTTTQAIAETIFTSIFIPVIGLVVLTVFVLLSFISIVMFRKLKSRSIRNEQSFVVTSSPRQTFDISESFESHLTINMCAVNGEVMNRSLSIDSERTGCGSDYDDTVSCDSTRTSELTSVPTTPVSVVPSTTVSAVPSTPVSMLNPIVVLSQKTPESDKEEILKWLLKELTKYKSPNGATIVPTAPGLERENVRSTAFEWLENQMSNKGGPNEPCFLCVVNQEFKEDWDRCGFSSTDTFTSNNHCLVYPLSRHLYGMAQYRMKAKDHIMVLYWTDTIPKSLVPPCLRECRVAHVKDTKKIVNFIFKLPEII